MGRVARILRVGSAQKCLAPLKFYEAFVCEQSFPNPYFKSSITNFIIGELTSRTLARQGLFFKKSLKILQIALFEQLLAPG